ncbi:MAG TPA: DNA-3-methyladenine glycosylase [Acidimicrobiia bacterium]|nr:DNA-3-methyladenine glycosylase [Acidimicrobiia bacterium]
MKALPRSFYARDSRELAPLLLNKLLVTRTDDGVRLAARLVEVEAYCGSEDPGSHAYRGMTPRTEVMFGPPGHLYVYFTYGMHWCANVVATKDGDAAAVLLRAAAPVDGIDVMRERRVKARRDRDLLAGPARLCQAFGITKVDNGNDLVRGRLRIVDDGVAPPAAPGVSTRIGLAVGRGDDHPWRFFVPGDPNLSR